MSVPVSCLVFTLNEAINLPFCLESLSWCDDVIIIDSYSTDESADIAAQYGAKFVQHEFTGFGDQRRWALEQVPLKHPWALILDADERVPESLALELAERLGAVSNDVAAFRVRRRFHLFGKWIRYSSLYPTWVVRLVRVGRVEYINRGHAETEIVQGTIESLRNDLIDENHKGLKDWWVRQVEYARRDAIYELSQATEPLSHIWNSDPLKRRAALKSLARHLPFRPTLFFIYSYFLRLGFLDGMDGYRFCRMKAIYQSMVTIYKREARNDQSGRRPVPSVAHSSAELKRTATSGKEVNRQVDVESEGVAQ